MATTVLDSDDDIEKAANLLEIPVYRGSVDDVVNRIDQAVKLYYPEAEYIFRGLGDCPFLDAELVARALRSMDQTKSEAFLWHLAPDTWPVYGAREFPYSRSGWSKIVAGAVNDEREHVDAFFHKNRDKFKIVYHEPPANIYFRNYRLEIDWFEDLDLIEQIHKAIGLESSLKDVIHFLDEHPIVAIANKDRVEKTGPLTSYDYTMRRTWMKSMTGKPIVGWDDTIWNPPDDRSFPVFCGSGKCLIGYGKDGILYRKNGDRIGGDAYINCQCESGKYWKEAKRRLR